jgi:hypothetical protein
MANVISFADLMQTAQELGEQAGKGKDTQVKFLLKAVEGGYHAALDLNSNKHGTDVDDATKLAATYVKAQNSTTVFDAKSMNQRKLISTLRTSIKLGSWPKGGNGEPLATVGNLMSMRQKLRTNPAVAKKLDDAANTLLKYARAQIRRDTLIPDTEFDDFLYKPGKNLPTTEDILSDMTKQLDKIIAGSAASGTAQDSSAEVRAARHALQQRLAAIAKARAPAPGQTAKVTP